MQPLIDADIFLYEIGFAAEAGWKSPGFPTFDYVADLLDSRIANICAVVEATEEPILYLTGHGNFREQIAKRRVYKDRAGNKPWHYKNIKAYMKSKYRVIVSEGMEADDLMSIEATRRPGEVIICTRDKDLRSVPGWHYGWEVGNQPQFGPELVTELGWLRLSPNRKKLSGTGLLFFYAQCLLGDSVDTVPGLPSYGPVKAFETLSECQTTEEAFKRVLEAYRGVYEASTEEELLEQGRLLWMTRELNEDGSPKLWRFPDENVDS